ncbi:MAG: S8 family serine peptidase [Acidobacteriota bacterium]
MTEPAPRDRALPSFAAVLGCVLVLLACFGTLGHASLPRLLRAGFDRLSPGLERAPARIAKRSARALAVEQRALATNPRLLRIAGLDFDPRVDGALPQVTGLPAALASGLSLESVVPEGVSEDVVHVIVQYERSTEVRKELEELGVEIVEAVPNDAYLVRTTPALRPVLDTLPSVTWSGDYLPAYKIDALSRAMISGQVPVLDVDRRGLLRFQVHFHERVDASPYETLLKQAPGAELESLVHYREDPAVAHLLVEPLSLEPFLVHVARLRDVVSIDFVPVLRPHIDHSIWWLMTGIDDLGASNYDVSARLFALGIAGEGLIGAVISNGVENDNCAFKFTDDINDACWPIGGEPTSPTSPAEEEGELDQIRTRMRKVVAYLLFTGAAPYSAPDQHGTTVTACMAGDVFGPGPNGALAARPLIRDLGTLQNILSCERLDGDWQVGDQLRPELSDRVDDPFANDVQLPVDYGFNVQHHQAQDGVAPAAQILVQDIGNAAGDLIGGWQASAAYGQADDYGATVHSASFGGDPCTNCYNQNAALADIALWRERMLTAFASAGNDGAAGPETIGAGLAHAKNILTIGATVRANTPSGGGADRTGEDRANYSSIGPASGGTLKPELLTPGSLIAHGAAGPAEDGTGTGNNDCGIPAAVTGTSYSTPSAAGLGLLVQQYFFDGWYPSGVPTPEDALRPTNALTRAVLINSAHNLEGLRTDDTGVGSADRPTYSQGWGAPRLDDTLYFSGDPLRDDPRGDTERARLMVFTDTPNGLTTTDPADLVPEPGGTTRNELVQSLRTALSDGERHAFSLNVLNPDPNDVANELRFTMCYTDAPGGSLGAPILNDLDLEVVSPSGVVYRPDPVTAWSGSFTQPSSMQVEQELAPPFVDLPDRDPLNTCENVFVENVNVEEGTWQVHVIGFDVPGGGGPDTATPNFVRNDLTPTVDTTIPCDGVNDIDTMDSISRLEQGYALIVSGNFSTTQGIVSLNRSSFGCVGDELFVTVADGNGDDSAEPPCGEPGVLSVSLVTSTPSPAFPRDMETILLTGSAPLYTNAIGVPVVVVASPGEVIHEDGVIQAVHGETFTVTYEDANPCGGPSTAQGTVVCQPVISDEGFQIAGGCDVVNPAEIGTSTVRPDQFLDAGETVRYTVFFLNGGSEPLTDAVVSLEPNPNDPLILALGDMAVEVLDSPQVVATALPGARSSATFTVQVGSRCTNEAGPECLGPGFDGIPCRYSLDFIACVSAPGSDLLFPDCIFQTQVLEADLEVQSYSTRDPNGELYGIGGIREQLPGTEHGTTNPEDFRRFQPMWFDPDADCGTGPGSCGTICDVSRDAWPPPPICLVAPVFRGNPFDAWDFDDDDEDWLPASYNGDGNTVGRLECGAAAQEWFWKAAPDGGACGWESELADELTRPDSDFDVSHPDVFDQPWGIWHTGEINPVAGNTGPFPGAVPPNGGVPYFDDPSSPMDHTIYWDPPGPGDNSAGEWCQSYLSDPIRFPNFYRSFLKPPSLFRVHATNPDYRVVFRDLRMHARLDGHLIDSNNLTIAGIHVDNELVPGIPDAGGCPSYTWAQFEHSQLRFTDGVQLAWETNENTMGEPLSSLDPDFPDQSYEQIYGLAGSGWDFALSWSHLHFDGFTSGRPYGWGVDDVSFEWDEVRDICDASDCSAINGGMGQAPAVYFVNQVHDACSGELGLLVLDDSTAGLGPRISVCVSSDQEIPEKAVLDLVSPGRYEGSMPYTTDPDDDVDGVLLVSSGSADTGLGSENVQVEYDPFNASDHDPMATADETCDWLDADGDGVNDDVAPLDGVPDAEDGQEAPFEREQTDDAVVNCPTGPVFYIRHSIQDSGAGDGDGFADHGETAWLSVSLTSQLPFDLTDVTVSISTEDQTVCILRDSVGLDVLPRDNVLTATPVDQAMDVGLLFAVPAGVRTTDLANPQTVTFRIDVEGTSASNGASFSTFGTGTDSFLPMEARLLLDVNSLDSSADYSHGVDIGEFFEGFEGSPASGGLENPLIPSVSAGVRLPRFLDGTADTRYGSADNNGFCPECPFTTDCDVPSDCDHRFVPGEYVLSEPQWAFTEDWSHEGNQAFKFGDSGADETDQGQHYVRGQFATLELPPLRLASNPAITPTLEFRMIADAWVSNFTSGLSTPIGGMVIEASASPTGVDPSAPSTYRRPQHADLAAIDSVHPLPSYRRLYPTVTPYDQESDVLVACRTLFCNQHHPVFSTHGDAFNSPASGSDPRAGSDGHSTWELVEVDLSDLRGQEVVLRFTIQVMQDFEIQNGFAGWLQDSVRVTGVSDSLGLGLQSFDNMVETCQLMAAFESSSPDCFDEEVTFFDRHSGLGLFGPGGTPLPLEFEYELVGDAGTLNLGPFPEGTALAQPGVRGMIEDPIVDLVAAGVISVPGTVSVTQRLYQGGMEVSSFTDTVVSKDAPVPSFMVVGDGPIAGGPTVLEAMVSVLPAPDPDRELTYVWDFDDGSPLDVSGAVVSHVFPAPGDYDVELCVRDEDGCEGCVVQVLTVAAQPSVEFRDATVVDECAAIGSPGLDDGDPDFNEYVTIAVTFDNVGAAATDVTGFLSSSDPLAEIISGVASFGDVGAGATSAPGEFTFIRRYDADVDCVIVPFTLDLVGDGGASLSQLSFGITIGGDVAVEDVAPLTPPAGTLCMGDVAPVIFSKAGPAGCLTGLTFNLDVQGIALATNGDVNVVLRAPSGVAVPLYTGDGVSPEQDLSVCFTYDIEVGLLDTCSTLDAGVEGALLADLVTESMTGAFPWQVEVSTMAAGDCLTTGQWNLSNPVLELRGTNSADADIGIEPACADCQAPTTPIFPGDVEASCPPVGVVGGTVTWTAATDTSECPGADELVHELYASTIEGQLGSPPMILGAGDSCLDCPLGETCVFPFTPGTTSWEVCDVTSTYWTVVVSDAGDPATRVPAVSAPADPVDDVYQSELQTCVDEPDAMAPVIAVTELDGMVEIWVDVPTGAGRPPHPAMPGGPVHHLFRGRLSNLRAAYNHQSVECSFTGPMVSLEPPPGSEPYYYLVPSANSTSCVGMGFQGTVNPTTGELEYRVGRPEGINNCGGVCLP